MPLNDKKSIDTFSNGSVKDNKASYIWEQSFKTNLRLFCETFQADSLPPAL